MIIYLSAEIEIRGKTTVANQSTKSPVSVSDEGFKGPIIYCL